MQVFYEAFAFTAASVEGIPRIHFFFLFSFSVLVKRGRSRSSFLLLLSPYPSRRMICSLNRLAMYGVSGS